MVVGALLIPPWSVFLLACYWTFIDNEPPIVVRYEHPLFLSEPAQDRVEAERFSVREVASGKRVYVYREICMDGQHDGTLRSVWESKSFVWPAAERAYYNPTRECQRRNDEVLAPSSNPTREFLYRAWWVFDVNPLTTVNIPARQIPLRVLAPNEVRQ
jgi:hypothetical protein